MAKKIEDKTFGMKNKNKSKQVQQQIAQMKAASGIGKREESASEQKAKAAAAAIDDLLFKEAKSKKDLAREALAKAAALEAKAKKPPKEPDKKDIFVDYRELKKEDDTMDGWDDAKLQEVVNKKAGGQGERVRSDIICRHFLDAVETRRYGWFWECPNGGDKCQYRHALPEGYVLKRDKEVDPFAAAADEGPRLEDEIEAKRKALTVRTPVTLERLLDWLEKKKAAAAQKEEEEMEALRSKYAKTGKAAGVTGKQLFTIDSSLFVDDAAANDVHHDVYADLEEAEDGADGADAGEDAGTVTATSRAQTIVPLKPGDIRPPTPPPEDPEPEPALDVPLPPPPPPAGTADKGDDACTACAPGAPEYGANYEERNGASSSSVAAPSAAAVADLDGVDESLFLDDDLPDDDELE